MRYLFALLFMMNTAFAQEYCPPPLELPKLPDNTSMPVLELPPVVVFPEETARKLREEWIKSFYTKKVVGSLIHITALKDLRVRTETTNTSMRAGDRKSFFKWEKIEILVGDGNWAIINHAQKRRIRKPKVTLPPRIHYEEDGI